MQRMLGLDCMFDEIRRLMNGAPSLLVRNKSLSTPPRFATYPLAPIYTILDAGSLFYSSLTHSAR